MFVKFQTQYCDILTLTTNWAELIHTSSKFSVDNSFKTLPFDFIIILYMLEFLLGLVRVQAPFRQTLDTVARPLIDMSTNSQHTCLKRHPNFA